MFIWYYNGFLNEEKECVKIGCLKIELKSELIFNLVKL